MVKKKGFHKKSKSSEVSKVEHVVKVKIPDAENVRRQEIETMALVNPREIALDFGTKVYEEFDHLVKSIVLFGSVSKEEVQPKSDIDLVIIIDDVSISWDSELIAHYRETLGEIVKRNPYIKPIHVNSVKLSTWWEDLARGDPVVINVLRHGEVIIDHAGFFAPLQVLLREGKIKPTPEAVYTLLQRAPGHLARARASMLAVVDGLYWCCVDSAHAALIAKGLMPSSPEHIADDLRESFVKEGLLNKKFVRIYEEIHELAKGIVHGDVTDFEGRKVDEMRVEADEFLREMARIVEKIVDERK